MGLLAREIETCGVTTVGFALVRDVAIAARAPRMLYLRWPFGHALGEPGLAQPVDGEVLEDVRAADWAPDGKSRRRMLP